MLCALLLTQSFCESVAISLYLTPFYSLISFYYYWVLNLDIFIIICTLMVTMLIPLLVQFSSRGDVQPFLGISLFFDKIKIFLALITLSLIFFIFNELLYFITSISCVIYIIFIGFYLLSSVISPSKMAKRLTSYIDKRLRRKEKIYEFYQKRYSKETNNSLKLEIKKDEIENIGEGEDSHKYASMNEKKKNLEMEYKKRKMKSQKELEKIKREYQKKISTEDNSFLTVSNSIDILGRAARDKNKYIFSTTLFFLEEAIPRVLSIKPLGDLFSVSSKAFEEKYLLLYSMNNIVDDLSKTSENIMSRDISRVYFNISKKIINLDTFSIEGRIQGMDIVTELALYPLLQSCNKDTETKVEIENSFFDNFFFFFNNRYKGVFAFSIFDLILEDGIEKEKNKLLFENLLKTFTREIARLISFKDAGKVNEQYSYVVKNLIESLYSLNGKIEDERIREYILDSLFIILAKAGNDREVTECICRTISSNLELNYDNISREDPLSVDLVEIFKIYLRFFDEESNLFTKFNMFMVWNEDKKNKSVVYTSSHRSDLEKAFLTLIDFISTQAWHYGLAAHGNKEILSKIIYEESVRITKTENSLLFVKVLNSDGILMKTIKEKAENENNGQRLYRLINDIFEHIKKMSKATKIKLLAETNIDRQKTSKITNDFQNNLSSDKSNRRRIWTSLSITDESINEEKKNSIFNLLECRFPKLAFVNEDVCKKLSTSFLWVGEDLADLELNYEEDQLLKILASKTKSASKKQIKNAVKNSEIEDPIIILNRPFSHGENKNTERGLSIPIVYESELDSSYNPVREDFKAYRSYNKETGGYDDFIYIGGKEIKYHYSTKIEDKENIFMLIIDKKKLAKEKVV